MKVKVCGLRDLDNIAAIAELRPDYLGFIFYPQSPRVVRNLNPILLQNIDSSVKKIGVFVDAPAEEVAGTATRYFLSGVQLHGSESPQYCAALGQALRGIEVFKVFKVGAGFNFEVTARYEGTCTAFLFDTAGAEAGGTGQSFCWGLLEEYRGKTPFLLSGGIGPGNIGAAKAAVLGHPHGAGVDVNSRVEISPGLKSVTLVQQIIKEVRS